MGLKSGMKNNLGDGRTKMLFLVGVIFALIAGGVAVIALSSDGPGASAQAPAAPTVARAASAQPTPLERELIREDDRRRATAAQQTGGAAIPTIIPQAVADRQEAASSANVTSPSTEQPVEDRYQQERRRDEEQRRQKEVQAKLAFMQAMLGKEKLTPAEVMVVRYKDADEEKDSAPAPDALADPARAQAPPPFPKPPVQSIVYAFVTGEVVSTDVGTPVRARLVGERYEGLTALGSFVQREAALALEFTQLADSKGNTVSFHGVAVDPNSERASIEGDDVEHHYLEQGLLLFGSAFIEGLGEAYRTANTTTTSTLFGTTTTRGDVDLSDATISAAGKVGERVGQTMGQAAAARPPTVTLFQGRPIGILVLE